ncbi:putative sodium-coupled neutral amino acid transporter 10 [Agrilus planipennis]|uniref:Sodium-coupled neutral amino acid transporter 10 n=1 Tax=Agrilus planipennis TaxID=224129 RepID=A0A1W4XM04_AGRPL|nr:putative sodium-coupled neutral amino acid transporter 10 [Agrilus planipennis]
MNQKVSHIMTIANSIIGVGLLAMPYCFKQCGILLSICILVASNAVSRLSCHLLLKSAIIARRKTFENLAFHAFGSLGKFIIEIGIIGFLLGTCIAFFVVMGDLGPAIITKVSGTHSSDTIRTSLLMALALFCVLPLGLLRNVDSLTSVSTASVGFYFCLVVKVITDAGPHVFSGDWTSRVNFWRPAGILQCMPIFTMALFCQTQIFEIYQAIPNASLDKMNELIRAAVNICTWVYIFVGIFGYIAFCNQPFTGNILMSFTPSIITDVMSIGFVLSLAFSFPLVIFPCRASLYSLLYKQAHSSHEITKNYIPEGKFKCLTFIIVFISLLTGVLIPNIELVLGLVGSTIGIMICVVFPATCFICISMKNTNERIAAQVMLFIGIMVMVLGTYANLYAIEQTTIVIGAPHVEIKEPAILKIVKEDTVLRDNAIDIPSVKTPEKKSLDTNNNEEKPKIVQDTTDKAPHSPPPLQEIRQEPPQPVEPEDVPKNEPHQVLQKESVNMVLSQQNKSNGLDTSDTKLKKEANVDVKKNTEPPPKQVLKDTQHNSQADNEEQKKENKNSEKRDEVDIDAIRKEEKELMDQDKERLSEEKSKLELLKTLKKQQEFEKQLLETQKELLGQIKQQNKKDDTKQNEIVAANQEELKKAVKQIENIAKKAIESLNQKKEKNQVEDRKKVNEKEQNNGGNDEVRESALQVLQQEVVENKQIVEEQKRDDSKKNIEKDLNDNPPLKLVETIQNQEQIIPKNKIIPMPLVNSQIYNTGASKGFVPLLNKTSLKEPNALESNKTGTNILDVLKGANVIKNNTNNAVNNEIFANQNQNEQKQEEKVEREKRDIEENENNASKKVCQRDENELHHKKEIDGQDQNEQNLISNKMNENEKLNNEQLIAKKLTNDNKLVEDALKENNEEKIELQKFVTQKPLKDELELPNLNDVNLLAKDIQKDMQGLR